VLLSGIPIREYRADVTLETENGRDAHYPAIELPRQVPSVGDERPEPALDEAGGNGALTYLTRGRDCVACSDTGISPQLSPKTVWFSLIQTHLVAAISLNHAVNDSATVGLGRVAMQKVVGSSPIIRFKNPRKSGVLVL